MIKGQEQGLVKEYYIGGDGGGAMIFTGTAMADQGQSDYELNGELLFTFKKDDQTEEELVVSIDESGKDVDTLVGLIEGPDKNRGLTDLIVFKGILMVMLHY